jgi:hypothetical protein
VEFVNVVSIFDATNVICIVYFLKWLTIRCVWLLICCSLSYTNTKLVTFWRVAYKLWRTIFVIAYNCSQIGWCGRLDIEKSSYSCSNCGCESIAANCGLLSKEEAEVDAKEIEDAAFVTATQHFEKEPWWWEFCCAYLCQGMWSYWGILLQAVFLLSFVLCLHALFILVYCLVMGWINMARDPKRVIFIQAWASQLIWHWIETLVN